MPGDLARVVAREVAELERAPERHLDRARQHRQVEQQARLELGRLDLGVEVRARAAERAQRQPVQVLEQLALPRVPDLRAGAAHVGDGQQVERGEAPLAADGGGEIGDHVGVGEVFLLGDARHRQVLGDEELDQRRVGALDAVVAAEARDLARAELGVVAAAALGDVVEERGDVEHPGPLEGRGELRAERVLVGVLGDQEAAHVAQHHQDVLVDGVDVEQVVLHLADDAAKDPEVAAEDAGLVHQAKGVRLAAAGLQDLHEGRVVDRVAPELRVHQVARVVERAQRPRREALRPDRLLVDQEGLEDRVRVALVEVVARDLEHAAALEELLRDRPHRRVLQAGDALLDVEHQDLVQLRHRLGRPVVAPHQPLGGALAAERAVAEALGDGGLQVEHQAVLAPPGDRVQAGADQLEHAAVPLQLAHLERRDQAVRGELLPGAAEAGGARDPDHGLQVAQPARAFLAVGLERVGRVLVLLVALAHLERLGAQERLRIHRRGDGAARTP